MEEFSWWGAGLCWTWARPSPSVGLRYLIQESLETAISCPNVVRAPDVCMCVYAHVCTCMRVHKCICRYVLLSVCIWRPQATPGVLSLSIWTQRLSFQLDLLLSEPWRSSPSMDSLRLQAHAVTPGVYVGAVVLARVLRLTQQAL